MDENNYGFIISPSILREDFNKGETYQRSFSLTNAFGDDNAEKHTFYIYVRFLYQEGDSNIIYDNIPSDKTAYSMVDWIELENNTVEIKKNQRIEVNYSINVPENAPPGAKYAAIVISKSNPEELNQVSGAQLSDQIAYQIIGNVEGQLIKSADIVEFSTNKKVYWLWPLEKAEFTLKFKNNGNVAYLPAGDIFLHTGDITKDIWNKKINKNQLIVLPDNTRSFIVNWEAENGAFKSSREGITLNLDYIRFGKYEATAKVGIDQNNQRVVIDKMVSFYIIPLPLILAIVATGLCLKLFSRLRKKRNNKIT